MAATDLATVATLRSSFGNSIFMSKGNLLFEPATDNYKISSGKYSFLVCSIENSEDNISIEIECKRLSTALKKVVDKIDSSTEILDYEVALYGMDTTFINLMALPSNHFIHAYLS